MSRESEIAYQEYQQRVADLPAAPEQPTPKTYEQGYLDGALYMQAVTEKSLKRIDEGIVAALERAYKRGSAAMAEALQGTVEASIEQALHTGWQIGAQSLIPGGQSDA